MDMTMPPWLGLELGHQSVGSSLAGCGVCDCFWDGIGYEFESRLLQVYFCLHKVHLIAELSRGLSLGVWMNKSLFNTNTNLRYYFTLQHRIRIRNNLIIFTSDQLVIFC